MTDLDVLGSFWPAGQPDNRLPAAWFSMLLGRDLPSNCAGRSTTPGAWSSRPVRQTGPYLSGSPRCSDRAARRSGFSVTRRRGRSRWITVSLEGPARRSVRPIRQRRSTTHFRCSRVPTSTTTPRSSSTQSRFGWGIWRNGSPGRVCTSIRNRIRKQLTTYASRCPLPHDTRPRRTSVNLRLPVATPFAATGSLESVLTEIAPSNSGLRRAGRSPRYWR